MADDQVLADLQRLMDAPPEAPPSDPFVELEALVHDHQERLSSIVQEYDAKRSALEAQIAARSKESDAAARAAEIERLRAEIQKAA